MASSTALKAAYETEIAKISDTLDKARATYLKDSYIEALDKQNQLEANGVESYTIAGRTIQRANMAEGRGLIRKMESELQELIYGSEVQLDMNTGVAEPSGST